MSGGVPMREVLKLAPLQQARLVAGATGLDRTVRYVNIMEVPDILQWVKPDELLLTTTYPLRDERAALSELIPRLAEKGLAGMAIKPARYIDSIPQVMVDTAEQLSFPLLELPPDSSFDDIINSVLTVILNAQALRLQRAAAVHDRFTSIVLSGGGLRQIAQALAELIARPVLIVDSLGSVLTRSSDASLLGQPDGNLQMPPLKESDGPQPEWVTVKLGGREHRAALEWIRVGTDLHGAIVVLEDREALGEEELEALQRAATVAALRLVQARAVAEADQRFQAVCLEELVTGHVDDRSVLRERAIAFGWDLAVPRAVLVAELEKLGERPFSQLAGTMEEARARHRLAEAARAIFGKGAIVWERSSGIAALVAPGLRGRVALKELGAALQTEAEHRLGTSVVAVGLGRICSDPLELHNSYTEALGALAVGRRAGQQGRVLLFEDLGLERLLMSCPPGELAAFCEATLGRLMAYDELHQTDLLGTLETYLQCGGSATAAARALYVHYNTLKHRLDRMEEILGPFLGNSDQSLNLALALRIRKLLLVR